MRQKKRRTTTLRKRILLSILMIVVLQMTLIMLIIGLSGTIRQLNSGTEQILKNTVSYKGTDIQSQFLKWVEISSAILELDSKCIEMERTHSDALASLMEEETVRNQFLTDTSDVLLKALRQSGATGSFIILEDGEGTQAKTALYLRDLNPTSTPENNFDILVEAGGGHQMLEKGFALDSNWTMKLPITESDAFYYKPMKAAELNGSMSSRDLGYFSTNFRLRNNDIQIMTYTVPLFDKNHKPYGVLGIEIGMEYLKSHLPSQEIGIDKDASYLLGIRDLENERVINTVLIEGNKYSAWFASHPIDLEGSEPFWQVNVPNKQNDVVAYISPIDLYNSNTPFENEEWVLLGMVEKKVMYQDADKLLTALYMAGVLSFLISLMGAVYITKEFVRPIQQLMHGVEIKAGRKILLPKTNIVEFDELAGEIERLNEETYQTGAKVANIIDISGLPLGVFEFAAEDEKVFCTRQICVMLNIPMTNWQDNYISRADFKEVMGGIRKNFKSEEVEAGVYCYQDKGEERYLRFSFVEENGRSLYIVMDVTSEVQDKIKIKHDRDYDVLTNLYNRRAFAREMPILLEDAECTGAILSVWDLDNLKFINDTYGHDMGDKYICLLASVFTNSQQDKMMVARMSGDEFMLFSYHSDRKENYRRITEIHRTFLNQKMQLPDGSLVSVSASTGMVEYGEDSITYQELVRYADFAMYEAKNKERGSIRAFSKDAYIKDYVLVQGVGELYRILKESAVRYSFQPIFDIYQKTIFAYEALMRPQSEILMRPDELLRIAMTQSKLKQVEIITWFEGMKEFFTQCPEGEIQLFLNSLPDQCLTDEEFEEIERLYGTNLQRLVMEVTEMTQTDTLFEKRKQEWCGRWKARIALDDFGSGYSNPDFLVTRELDFIKLDRGLIQNIHLSTSRQKFVKSVIEYCHENGIKVISEGIELREELEEVVRLGTDYVQGYYLGKPAFEIQGLTDLMIERLDM